MRRRSTPSASWPSAPNGADGYPTKIHEVDPNTVVSLGTLKTAVTGRTMSIDPQTGRLYILAADIDPAAPITPGPGGRPGRPKPLPGSLKLLFLDPGVLIDAASRGRTLVRPWTAHPPRAPRAPATRTAGALGASHENVV